MMIQCLLQSKYKIKKLRD